MRVLPCIGISLLLFEIYKDVYYVQYIWLSFNKGQSFIIPFRRTIIVSQDHTRKWCQGRAEMLFSRRQTVTYMEKMHFRLIFIIQTDLI